jgi:hypothetical protein
VEINSFGGSMMTDNFLSQLKPPLTIFADFVFPMATAEVSLGIDVN